MRISIDIDGVAADYLGGFISWAKSQGIISDTPVVDSYQLWGRGMPFACERDYLDAHFRAVKDMLLMYLKPLPDFRAGISQLEDAGCQVAFCTTRLRGCPQEYCSTVRGDTRWWLEQHGLSGVKVDFVDDKTVLGDMFDVFIEDDPAQVRALAVKTPVVMPRQSYNTGVRSGGNIQVCAPFWVGRKGIVEAVRNVR